MGLPSAMARESLAYRPPLPRMGPRCRFSMPEQCDVLIAGLGAMGSSAAFHCARRGWKVIGLDRYSPPHSFGSSHGQTRIIREAYFEHPAYVPLVQGAYFLWDELEKLSGERLFQKTGGLMIGPETGSLFTGA